MIRALLTVLTAIFCVGSAVAQSDLLPSTALMREQAQALYRDLNGMVKGEAPYDKAKAEAAMAKLKDTASRIPTAFPESSKGKMSPNTRYSASEKVWSDKGEFNVRAANMSKAIDANASKVGTLEELKTAYPAVNGACNACHEEFRVRKN